MRNMLWMASALAAVLLTGGLAYNSYAAATAPPADKSGAAVTEKSGKACDGHKWADVKLNDEQKAQLKAIAEKYRPAMKPLYDKVKADRSELMKLTHADTLDDAAIKAAAAKLSADMPDLAVQRAHALKEMRSLLTPDQVAKLTGGKKEWKEDFFLMRMARKLSKESGTEEPEMD